MLHCSVTETTCTCTEPTYPAAGERQAQYQQADDQRHGQDAADDNAGNRARRCLAAKAAELGAGAVAAGWGRQRRLCQRRRSQQRRLRGRKASMGAERRQSGQVHNRADRSLKDGCPVRCWDALYIALYGIALADLAYLYIPTSCAMAAP